MSDNNCTECKHFHENFGNRDGDCRRFPPQITGHDEDENQTQSYPIVGEYKNYICSEFSIEEDN